MALSVPAYKTPKWGQHLQFDMFILILILIWDFQPSLFRLFGLAHIVSKIKCVK